MRRRRAQEAGGAGQMRTKEAGQAALRRLAVAWLL